MVRSGRRRRSRGGRHYEPFDITGWDLVFARSGSGSVHLVWQDPPASEISPDGIRTVCRQTLAMESTFAVEVFSDLDLCMGCCDAVRDDDEELLFEHPEPEAHAQ